MEHLPLTVEGCHELIRLLLKTIDDLSNRVKALGLENKALQERLNSNSSNSSKPPSSDFKTKKNKSSRKPSGKKSGGQIGHKGHYRELLPQSEVDSITNCLLPPNCLCGSNIKVTPEDYIRHQVHELPLLKLHVTEYQLQKGCCDTCGRKHIAELPNGVTWGLTGPRLTSFMSELITKYGLSRREQKAFLEEHFQFRISLGTVFNKQKLVNAALEAPVSELLPLVKMSNSVHADETGHNHDGKHHWMWGFISTSAAYFSIQTSRGKKVLSSLLGDFKNIIISDRYAAYNYFDTSQRQLCWAHLNWTLANFDLNFDPKSRTQAVV